MSGTPRERRCPECGARDWHIPRSRDPWSAAERVSFVAALAPLVWLMAVHLLCVVAWIQLGHWPGSGGNGGDLASVPVVRGCIGVTLVAGIVVIPSSAFVCLVIVASLIGVAVFHHRDSMSALRAIAVAITCWTLTILVSAIDPARVFVWLMD